MATGTLFLVQRAIYHLEVLVSVVIGVFGYRKNNKNKKLLFIYSFYFSVFIYFKKDEIILFCDMYYIPKIIYLFCGPVYC